MAIEYSIQAVECDTDDLEDRAMAVSGLGVAYHARFTWTGALEDVNESINIHHQALSILPEQHWHEPAFLLRLGGALETRFLYFGNIQDIDDSIQYLIEASNLEFENAALRSNVLSGGLGHAYESRFSRLRDVADIDNSIKVRKMALDLALENHPEYALRLVELASSYTNRFAYFKELYDIHQAIELYQRGVELTPDDNCHKPEYLDELGSAYLQVFNETKSIADLDQAILRQSQASSLQGSREKPSPVFLNNRCASYISRYGQTGSPTDIDNAISSASQALLLTPESHVDRILGLMNLGYALKLRFYTQGDQADLLEAIQKFSTAALLRKGDPQVLLEAAQQWGLLSSFNQETPGLDAYFRIMELLQELVWIGFPVKRRLSLATTVSLTLTTAIRVAIQHNLELALEWSEQGRSVVWKQTLQLRTPLELLKNRDPELFDRVQATSKALEQTIKTYAVGSDVKTHIGNGEESARLHRHLAQTWEGLMSQINNVLGEHNPCRPKKAVQLRGAARSGTVIIVNDSEDGCDAIIIRPSDIQHILLPLVTADKLAETRQQLRQALNLSGVRSSQHRNPVFHCVYDEDKSFKEVLAQLWTAIVEPIIRELSYEPKANVEDLPRVTWCTTGSLAFLPLHAAGIYDESHPDSKAYKHMISSYTPTLTALLNSPNTTSEFRGILGIGQANLDKPNALPATIKELDAIAQHAKPFSFTRLDEAQATPDAVLKAMRSHSWVHLACHAEQNTHDPTKSCFQLHNGTLDLARIAEEPLECAEFAFLAACQTASGDENVPDEAVHLAAGMLMAGYRTVIATMWSINDDDAPLVANQVYAYMMKDGRPDSTRAAKALHLGVQSLRDKIGEDKFGAWVPFIHMGV
ncbi:CHAT domain protein [Ceratobasidium sp. AG-Ba]|nr:CHAT domain protein [Ceratobasidium sp. AG-Ba]